MAIGGGQYCLSNLLSRQSNPHLLCSCARACAAERADHPENPLFPSLRSPTRRTRKHFYPVITEPQEAGVRLERGGAFGPVPRKYDHSRRKGWDFSPNNAADYLRWRELDFRQPRRDVLGDMMLPNSAGVEVSQFTSKVYSGQYSSDGNFFYTACQDFRCVLALAPRVSSQQRPLRPNYVT